MGVLGLLRIRLQGPLGLSEASPRILAMGPDRGHQHRRAAASLVCAGVVTAQPASRHVEGQERSPPAGPITGPHSPQARRVAPVRAHRADLPAPLTSTNRSRFLMEDGVPVQRVTVTSGRPVVRERVTDADLGEPLAALAAEPLDPADGPLRSTLLRLSDDDWLLAVLLHHLVIDDWSLAFLDREFSRFYPAAGHRRRGGSATATARRLRGRPAQHPAQQGRPPAPDGAAGRRAGPQHDPVRPAPARRAQ